MPESPEKPKKSLLERLKTRRSFAKKPREGFKEDMESSTVTYRKDFDLGAPEAGRAYKKERKVDVSKLKAEEVYIFSSAGATEFDMVWHEPEWYKTYIDAANQVVNCYDLLDSKTQRWVRRVKPLLKGLIEMGELNDVDYQKKYRKKIWKMVQKHGTYKVYGKKGVFNLLLIFRRAVEVYPTLEQTTDQNFDPKSLNIQSIKLFLGRGKGKRRGQKDRYAYVVIKRKREKGERIAETPITPTLSSRQKRHLNRFIEKLEMPWFEKPPKSRDDLEQWLLFWHLNYAKSNPLDRPESFEALKRELEQFAEERNINQKDLDQILSFLRAKSIEPLLGDYEYEVITSLNQNLVEGYSVQMAKEWWTSMGNWQRALYKMDWKHYLPWTLAQTFPEQEQKKSFSRMKRQEIQNFFKEDKSRTQKVGNFLQ